MQPNKFLLITCCALFVFSFAGIVGAKEKVHAIYIPLADHYTGIVAYEKYRNEMKEADYEIEQMKSWPSLQGKFLSGKADLAYVISPMAMEIFRKKNQTRWISLIHRDGNALAINAELEKFLSNPLPPERKDRKPTADVAEAFSKAKSQQGKPIVVGVPSLLATHTVVLYKYLKDHGKTLAIGKGSSEDVLARAVAPPVSPDFIKQESKRGKAAAFEQSLPWADVVETGGFGKVGWYSKDVLKWNHGHVECIVIAQGDAISKKNKAIKEVVYYIHKAGLDIEAARQQGGDALVEIANMIRKHIPGHPLDAIIKSLDPSLQVISYTNLNVDKSGLKQVMDLAVEAGVMKSSIDIEKFADPQFSTDITQVD